MSTGSSESVHEMMCLTPRGVRALVSCPGAPKKPCGPPKAVVEEVEPVHELCLSPRGVRALVSCPWAPKKPKTNVGRD
jgi:hypothetical protein